MSWLVPSVIATMSGTALLSFIYFYLYFQDRKKYLAIWALSWSIYFTRYVFMLLIISGQQNAIFLIANQTTSLLSGILLLWGAYIFMDKEFPRVWIYFCGLGFIWIVVSASWKLPFLIMSIPTFSFLAVVYILTGAAFIKHRITKGYESSITGWAFVIWGIHKADYPLLRPVLWAAPFGYLFTTILEFIVALGMLLIYFQKVRNDLKEEKYFLQKAQEIGKIGTWELDIKKNELLWTDENYRIFGLPIGTKLSYETFLGCVHPDDREYVHKEWKAALDKKPYEIEHRLVVDGKIRWVREKAELHFDKMGKCIGGTGFTQNITERKKAEEALRKSEEKYRNLVEESFDGIFIQKGPIIIFANKRLNEMLGYAQGELMGLDHWLLYHPDYQKITRDRAKARMLGEEVVSRYEVKLQRKDGSWFYGEINARAITFPHDEESGIQVWVKDIDERKKAERALKESEVFLKILINAIPTPVFYKDRDGKYLWFNSAFEIFFGETKERLIGKSVYDLHPPELAKIYHAQDNKLFDSGGIQRYDSQMKNARGELRDIIFNKAVFTDSRGAVTGLIGVITDITERKNVEERLKESEAMHKELFDNSPTPLQIQDFSIAEDRIKELKKGKGLTDLKAYLQDNRDEVLRLARLVKIRKSNKAAHDMYKDNPTDHLVQRFPFVLKSDDMQHFVDQLVDFTEGKDWFEGEARNFDSKGNVLNILLKKVVIDRKNNGLSKIIATLTDVTELHNSHKEKAQLESRLQQIQKMETIGNLAGGIAHDFNNILFPIIGMSELLLEDLPRHSQEYENVREILKAGIRGSDLVKQILAFSRQSGHKLIPVRPQQILKEVMKLIRSTIPSYIEIEQNIQSDCGLLMADPTQIHQVAMNILTNAFHAVEAKGGKIAVTLEEVALEADELSDGAPEPGRYALLSITDTGHGISPDLMNKIFEPYFTTKEQGKGTGLGLAVALGIVRKLKGDIKVYSEVGKGTTFNIYLPLMEKAAVTDTVKQSEGDPKGNEHILLVDDEETIVNIEKQMLERLGYHVTERTSSLDALKTFKENPSAFDLVVTDMTMPNMTGEQLSRELILVRPDIPVIICTGFSGRIDQEKAEAIGVKGLLMKPAVRTEMAKMVRKVLDKVRDGAHK